MHIFSKHQESQVKVIDEIEAQVKGKALKFSTVEPVDDYDKDPRMCMTSVHFPKSTLIGRIENDIVAPLKAVNPGHYYYKRKSLHMTIKNVRVIHDPPSFDDKDVRVAKQVFEKVVPKYKKFQVFFYRLLLLPDNLSLVGTTEPELDNIHLGLDRVLKRADLVDDKKYTNSRFFFCNMTLVRFTQPLTRAYKQMVEIISKSLEFEPYAVDSVSLIVTNASLAKCKKIGAWKLK